MRLTPFYALTLTRSRLCSPQLRAALERVISAGTGSTETYMEERGLISSVSGLSMAQHRKRWQVVNEWRRQHGCPEWRIQRGDAIRSER